MTKKQDKAPITKEQQIDMLLEKGFSRKALCICKNEKCYNNRKLNSAYCLKCSNKNKDA